MKTKAESKSILDDWVVSKNDSAEDPNFGFVETLYQTCSAALVSLWKSQSRTTKPGPHKSTLKKDVASIRLWEENFPSGHLDTILAESSDLKIAVLENLTGIAKVLVHYFTEGNEAMFDTLNKSKQERNFANELETQLEKASLMIDPDERSEPSSDDETSDDSLSTTERHQNRLGRLHSYISCLVDLAPVVERYIRFLQCKAEIPSVPIETVFRLSHRALPYAMRIRDRFTNAPTSLVERLAEANLERSLRLRTQEDDEEEVDDQSHRDAVTLFKPFSIFHDSGIGTSIPTISQYAATVASHTSFLSVDGEEPLGRPRVPSLPQQSGRFFQCDYCHKFIAMRDRIEWKMHVFGDLQSYICTHETCRDALKTFPTRKLWADHEFNEHFTLLQWRCFTCSIATSTPELFVEHLVQVHGIVLTGNRLRAAISEAKDSILVADFKDYKCLLCSQTGWQTKKAYATHVGRHLEEISLACLPRDQEDTSEDGFDTDISSTPGDIDGPTYSNGESFDVDSNSEAQYGPMTQRPSIPEPIPADPTIKVLESYPGAIMGTSSPEETSPQDRKGTLFPSLSLSNEQSVGSRSVRPSSYWSVAERKNFKMLLTHFGEDFEGISKFMKTKTPMMVRNYFNRRLATGDIGLGEAAMDAEARKARGEPPHPLTISSAATGQPDYQMEPQRTEQQKLQELERKRLESLQRNQMPTTDHSNQSKTTSGMQQLEPDYEQEIGQTAQQMGEKAEQKRKESLPQQQRAQIITADPSCQSERQEDDQRQQEASMRATKASNSQVPEDNGQSQKEQLVTKNVAKSRSDSRSFFSPAKASWSNESLGMEQATVSKPNLNDSGPWNLFRTLSHQGGVRSSLAPSIPPPPSITVPDPFLNKLDASVVYSAERDLESPMGPPSPMIFPWKDSWQDLVSSIPQQAIPQRLSASDGFWSLPTSYSGAGTIITESDFYPHGRSKSEEYVPPTSDGIAPGGRRKAISSQTPYRKVVATNESNDNYLSYTSHVTSKSDPQPVGQRRGLYSCPNCRFEGKNKAVFKRHISSMHYPEYEFRCHIDDCQFKCYRRDKIMGHYRFHGTFSSREIVDEQKILLPCPPICPLCSERIQDWSTFYRCFMDHCVVREGGEGQPQSVHE